MLGERNFAVFFAGYATSLTGSAMSQLALTFAVLGSGGSAADLGFVFAASVLPLVACMLGGGLLADRLGRRRVMLASDAGSFAVQAGLAAALFAGRPPIWLFIVLSALLATCEALFTPALGGLTPQLVPPGRLAPANALLGIAQAVARIAGPALAGLLIAVTSPAVVIAVDAATFGVSLIALSRLDVPGLPPALQSPWRDLAEGWAQFRAQPWMRAITIQFALFNLFSWAPYLLLGPVLARAYLGGAGAWGVVTALFAAGSIAGGAVAARWRPRRPLVAGVAAGFGYALPCLALALALPLAVVAAAAALAGIGSAIFNTYDSTVTQQRVDPAALARVTAVSLTGAYALGATGYAVIGPLSAILGARPMLAFAAAYAVVSSAIVLTLPAIRSVEWLASGSRPPAL